MYFVKLPALIASGENKGDPNIVDIKSSKLTDSDGKAIQYKIPAEQFDYPQFGPEPQKDENGNEIALTDEQAQEGIDEAIKDAGGKVRFLENYNSATRTAALNAGKNYIRTKETGSPPDIVVAGVKIAHEFSWAKAERLTNKEVRERVEQLAEDVDKLSTEELKARLRMLVGK